MLICVENCQTSSKNQSDHYFTKMDEESISLCCKQRFILHLTELLKEVIREEFPGCDLPIITFSIFKHKQRKYIHTVILPSSIFGRLQGLLKQQGFEDVTVRLQHCLQHVQNATSTWIIPVLSVKLLNSSVYVQPCSSLLSKVLLSSLVKHLVPQNKASDVTSHTSQIIVCFFSDTVSAFRTAALARQIHLMLYQGSKDITCFHLSQNRCFEDVGQICVNFGVPIENEANFASGVLSEAGLVQELREVVLIEADHSGNGFQCLFEGCKVNYCTSILFQTLYKSVAKTVLKLQEGSLKCLAKMHAHFMECCMDGRALDVFFVACQSETVFVKQIKMLLILLCHKSPRYCEDAVDKCGVCNLLDKKFMSREILHGPAILDGDKKMSLLAVKEKYAINIHSSFESKYGENSAWTPLVSIITSSVIKLDLLSASIASAAHLHFENNKFTFVLYNYSRVASLLSKFEENVKSGVYPALPDADGIDFSLLRAVEEMQLIDHLWLLEKVLGDYKSYYNQSISKPLQLRTFSVTSYLQQLCKMFSKFYSRHRILGNSLPHLFPTMHARLYLVKAVKCTLHLIFDILNISCLEQM